jgi:hypothetical protein
LIKEIIKMRSGIPVLILLLVFTAASYGQQKSFHGSNEVSDILGHMRNGDLHTQKVAFDNLMTHINFDAAETPKGTQVSDRSAAFSKFFTQYPDQADQVKQGLIQLLSRENYYFVESKNPPPDSYEEDEIGEHYAEVIDAVASLNDERAIPALVGAITTGGMAQKGLLKYGDKALEPVLAQLKNRDALVRASALGLGIALLEKRSDPTSLAQIRDLIRSSLTDPKPVVRSQAIDEIGCLDDRQYFVPMLRQISKTDPWKLPGRADDGEDGNEFYPVRFDARRALREIQDNKGCTP